MKKVLLIVAVILFLVAGSGLVTALFYPEVFSFLERDFAPIDAPLTFLGKDVENEKISSLDPIPSSYKISGIKPLAQKPKYPSGCESFSAVMALNHFGLDISIDDFISSYLKKSNNFYTKDGKNYGPDPKKVFVGDPKNGGSFGCYSPVIEEALKECAGDGATVRRCDGMNLQALCDTYVAKDVPVILWASIGMLPIYDDLSWYLEDGSRFYWPANEHCLLLTGYTDTHYIFNDPWQGKEVSWPKALVEQRYEQMGKMSVVLY